MSKQRVMEDLDALLDELQSSTSSTSQRQFTNSSVSNTIASDTSNTSRIIMDDRSSTWSAAGDGLDSEGQPIYEFQAVKATPSPYNSPMNTLQSSRISSNPQTLYTSVQKPSAPGGPKPYMTGAVKPLPTVVTRPTDGNSSRSVATLSSNLSELDSLLQELSSAQLHVEVDRLHSSTDKPPAVGNAAPSNPVADGNTGRTVPVKTASSATKELDDLMASLSDLDVQESMSPPYPSAVGHQPSIVANQTIGGSPDSRPMPVPTPIEPAGTMQIGANVTSPAVGAVPGNVSLNALMEDLDKNMTQQGVTTVPKGHCAACNKPIVGKVITALGRLWHPEHFVCVQCKEPLGTRNFFERDTLPYCEFDYHLLFSPRCAFCNGPILDKCVTALDRTWHPEHFTCAQCGCLLGPEVGFHERDGQAYCREDYYEQFAPKCGGCGRPIVENFITALNQQWHTHCFVCSECRMPFGAGSFFDHEGLPYCETHFHARRGSLCASCHKPVTGRCITAMYRKYHPEHFVCTYCNRQLNKGTFKEQNDKPYCHPCFVRLFS